MVTQDQYELIEILRKMQNIKVKKTWKALC